MVQYRRNQELLYQTPAAVPEDRPPDAARVREVFRQARRAGRTLLTEAEAKEVLAAYGVPVAASVPCRSADEATAAARRIGYPVVLKLLSTTITHKSDVGGVQLDLADEGAVRTAFATIRANVLSRATAEAFEGVSLQPMIRDRGVELIVGSTVDRQFGPVILFGAGGVLVEVLQDRALALPPLNRTLARRLIERTKIYRVLQGVRGRGPIDFDGLETLLVRFSQLLVEQPEIEEVDMNPVLASPERVIALDARLVLCPADRIQDRPRLAIHPYPNQYTAPFRLRGGAEAVVRAIGPEDEPLIVELHASHSAHTLRMRFFSLVKTLSRDSLIRLCHLDYDREMALVAVSGQGPEAKILGVSRYYLHPESGDAEFALVIRESVQRQGLGRHLLGRLIEIARERGVKRLVGLVLRENGPMLALTAAMGFGPPEQVEENVVRVVLPL
jgi:acetyltransferase